MNAEIEQRPPMRLTVQKLHSGERKKVLEREITKRIKLHKQVPLSWVTEYNELCKGGAQC